MTLSLRSKLIISVIVCLLIPAIATLAISNYFTQNILREQARSDAEESLEIIDLYMTNTIQKMIYISNNIMFDYYISQLMKENWKEKQLTGNTQSGNYVLNQVNINRQLRNLALFEDKVYISILGSEGTYYSNYSIHDYNPEQFYQEAWFQRIPDIDSFDKHWINVHDTYMQAETETHPHLITMVRRMINQPEGYMIVSFYEDHIKQILQNYGVKQEIYLINSSGEMISYSNEGVNKDLINQHILEEENAKLLSINEQDYLLMKYKMNYSDWWFVSLTPQSNVVTQISRIFSTITVVQIILYLMFLFVLIYLVRQFTKPIAILGRVVLNIESGDLSVRSNVRGGDEIGRFGRSFDKMLDRINYMIQEIRDVQHRKRKAELDMLQAQINPHFLFNTLNSIRLRILLNGDEENASLISSLSSLLRMTINRNNEFITLHEELDINVQYIELMNMRHKETNQFELSIAPECFLIEVPRFFLQPFIENALIHGLGQKSGKLSIRAVIKMNKMIVHIIDNGIGMSKEHLASIQQKINNENSISDDDSATSKSGITGIGMVNVCERMRMIYGVSFQCSIKSEPGFGTTIIMEIPIAAQEGIQDAKGHAGG